MTGFVRPTIPPDLAHTAKHIGEIEISPRTISALKRFEGFSEKIYLDTEGLETIGFGTLLADGISREEAELLLAHRLKKAIRELQRRKPIVVTLPLSVRRGLRRMAYNLGVPRLMLFKDMWACLERKDFPGAAAAALDSRWSKQVGPRRSGAIANLIRTPREAGELEA